MRLEVSRRADLAVRALIALGEPGQQVKGAALAERIGTTAGFLSHAMTPLSARGWVRSMPGRDGGYALVVDLDQLSVLDVMEAVEGPTDTGHCVLEDRRCASTDPCALHGPWSTARQALVDTLAGLSLSSVELHRR